MSRRHSAPDSLSNSARQQIDAIMATARNQIEAVLQQEVSRLMLQAQAAAEKHRNRPHDSDRAAAATTRLAAASPRIYVRPVECQALFGMHRATLYRWAKEGKITIHKRGSASFVRVDDVRALIEGIDT